MSIIPLLLKVLYLSVCGGGWGGGGDDWGGGGGHK